MSSIWLINDGFGKKAFVQKENADKYLKTCNNGTTYETIKLQDGDSVFITDVDYAVQEFFNELSVEDIQDIANNHKYVTECVETYDYSSQVQGVIESRIIKLCKDTLSLFDNLSDKEIEIIVALNKKGDSNDGVH